MSGFELIVRFLVVAGIFAISMVLLRRYVARQARATGSVADGFRVLSRLTLGKGNELVLVESAGRTYVVGVGDTHVLEVVHGQLDLPLAPTPSSGTPAAAAPGAPVKEKGARTHAEPLLLAWSRTLARWLGFGPRKQREGDFTAALSVALSQQSDTAEVPPATAETAEDPRPLEVDAASIAPGLSSGTTPKSSRATKAPAAARKHKTTQGRSAGTQKSGTSRAKPATAPAGKTPASSGKAARPPASPRTSAKPAPARESTRPKATSTRSTQAKTSPTAAPRTSSPPTSEEVGAFYRTLLIEPKDIAKDRP